jgi:hypothetical protein
MPAVFTKPLPNSPNSRKYRRTKKANSTPTPWIFAAGMPTAYSEATKSLTHTRNFSVPGKAPADSMAKTMIEPSTCAYDAPTASWT